MRSNIVIRIMLIAALPTLGLQTSADADFVMKGGPPPPAPTPAAHTAPIAMTPIVDPGDPGYTATTRSAPAHDTPTTVHWKMAYGFGQKVPLSFACRQIVPPAVRVTYGPGATPQMLVTWKGGDTWNHVLRDAVKPLGLHLVMTHMAVEIRK